MANFTSNTRHIETPVTGASDCARTPFRVYRQRVVYCRANLRIYCYDRSEGDIVVKIVKIRRLLRFRLR